MSDTDSILLGRCRRGDQAAWAELVARHTRRVFSLSYRFSGRADEAEDLTQEVFVKVYERLDRYEPAGGAFGAWLTTLARNHAIDHYRRRREERLRTVEGPDSFDRFAGSSRSPFRDLERSEQARLLRSGIRALPRDLREPLILSDLEGLPYAEIADTLELPLGTVKSRINRGRIELARRLLGRTQSRSRP